MRIKVGQDCVAHIIPLRLFYSGVNEGPTCKPVERRHTNNFGLVFWLVALACFWSCSASEPSGVTSQDSALEPKPVSSQTSAADVDPVNLMKLDAIRKSRVQTLSSADFPIGPGDVIEVSVPGMEELRNRQARVSAECTIELPILGTISVRGLSESELAEALRQHLKEYMKDPQVDVFVKQYQSREVAVGGMVEKPGLYTLTGPSDTILDMIGRAGGVKENASTRIVFIPASAASGFRAPLLPTNRDGNNSKDSEKPKFVAGTVAVKPVSAEHADDKDSTRIAADNQSEGHRAMYYDVSPAAGRDPIVIDISSLKNDSKLDVPVWPGDVIIIPAAGEVMVRGWVKNPGAFNITPGMTVLGAVTAAGGELYSSSAELLRTGDDGQETEKHLNIGKIQDGTETDLPVQSGDIVIVNRSVVGAVPYFLDSLFNKFTTGAYLPLL